MTSTTPQPVDPAVRIDAPRNVVLGLNPITVMTFLVAASAVSFFFEWRYAVGLVLACLLIASLAGRVARFLSMWLRSVVVLCVVIFALQTLLYPGETVVRQLWVFSVTEEGIAQGTRIATMVLAIGSAIILGSVVTDIRRLTRALEQRGTSAAASYVILSTVTMIPQLRTKMTTIMDAQRSRGIETDASLWIRAKAFVPTIGPLILNSIVGVEERALTLESRGFSAPGAKTSLVSIPDTSVDKTLRVLVYLGLALALIVRIWLWMR
ncbi:energy-coupling factor transporter transmembrane component T [Promicromonospora xylanilytica]